MEALSLTARESFDAVMRLYTPTVYGIAYARLRSPEDAEDVAQDVFVRYFKADLTYESEEHRKAWLIRCAVNCTNSCASSAQYRRRAASASLDEVSELPAEGGTEELAERSERKSAVLNAVAQLPPKYRTVVHLYYFEDMSIARISEAVDARESTVKTRLARARERLKKLLKGEVEF
ncbi:MAG: sigma-70 family RNA polymerase sigma factor [Lachnospiraceae bacterium]|nr:sigma-70 family RNA polymerase sigma factor [Ruminococcus sp.]MCM1274178.1 sigma-70 family RNA polymerase sigma factor [Lachnospiraceae bacterium]